MKTKDIAKLMGALVVVEQEYAESQLEVDKAPASWSGKKSRIERRWVPEVKTPRIGWVVGIRWLQNGYKVEASGLYDPDGYEPAYFQETAPRTPALLVTFWPTLKPVFVPLEGYRLATPEDGTPKPPTGWGVDPEYEASYREMLRKEMTTWPRNEKGQWVSA